VTPEDLAAELDLIRASMGQKPLHKHKRSITSSIEKWTNRRAITYQYASNLGKCGLPRGIFAVGVHINNVQSALRSWQSQVSPDIREGNSVLAG